MHLLEHGLFACESELAARFNDHDSVALQAAIAALEGIPNDPGFSLIGRVADATPEPATKPPPLDQFDLDLLAFTEAGNRVG